MKNEPVKTEFLSMAQAARSCGGKVYVQVSNESKACCHQMKLIYHHI